MRPVGNPLTSQRCLVSLSGTRYKSLPLGTSGGLQQNVWCRVLGQGQAGIVPDRQSKQILGRMTVGSTHSCLQHCLWHTPAPSMNSRIPMHTAQGKRPGDQLIFSPGRKGTTGTIGLLTHSMGVPKT